MSLGHHGGKDRAARGHIPLPQTPLRNIDVSFRSQKEYELAASLYFIYAWLAFL